MSENPQREELSHIVRPVLPWRTAADKCECGRGLDDAKSVVPLEEAQAIWKRHGKQRAAFLLCMICVSTVNRHSHWIDDAAHLLSREINWHNNDRLNAELTALGLLVAAHRDEFEETLAGLADAPQLAARRRTRRQS